MHNSIQQPWRWTVCVCLASFGLSTQAADLSAEERLQAIRSGIVEAAMKANTKVKATSWMDSDGALRELNRFSSEVKMRELQVKQYSRDAAQQPQAELVAAKPEVVAPNRCEAPLAKAPLRQVMGIDMAVSAQLPASQKYTAQQIGKLAQSQMLEAGTRATHWAVTQAVVQRGEYSRQMFGHGEEHLQWHLHITVAPAPWSHAAEDTSGFALVWQIDGPGAQKNWYSKQHMVVPAQASPIGMPKLDSDATDAVAQAVADLATDLDKKLACDPQSFVLSEAATGKILLNAGRQSGLRVGDKLMLADSGVLPRHALEADALDSAVLAEVKSVTPYQAELKQVAGRRQKFQGAWVAWPYTY
jgi:hypothetical protein